VKNYSGITHMAMAEPTPANTVRRFRYIFGDFSAWANTVIRGDAFVQFWLAPYSGLSFAWQRRQERSRPPVMPKRYAGGQEDSSWPRERTRQRRTGSAYNGRLGYHRMFRSCLGWMSYRGRLRLATNPALETFSRFWNGTFS
jgi:hypothetical protein